MTTNETMLALHKMIGGVKWREARRKHALAWDKAEGWVYVRPWGLAELATLHEAQALIEKAAIEWLMRDDRAVSIHSPGHPTGEGGFYEAWCVAVYGPKEMMDLGGSFPIPVRDILACEEGSTLLEALHAAVKETKDEH